MGWGGNVIIDIINNVIITTTNNNKCKFLTAASLSLSLPSYLVGLFEPVVAPHLLPLDRVLVVGQSPAHVDGVHPA